MDLRDFFGKVIKKKGGATKLADIVQASYPQFKSRMAAAPGQALAELAEYERENPIGSYNQALVGGIGALGFNAAKGAGKVFQGLEGAPKFEFSDAAATLKGLPKALQESKLSDVLDHPELYSQYPDLGDLKVKKIIPTLQNVGERGSFNPKTGEIMVEAGDEAKSTLLHEVQHAIQEREGFAKGGSPLTAMDKKPYREYGFADRGQVEDSFDNVRSALEKGETSAPVNDLQGIYTVHGKEELEKLDKQLFEILKNNDDPFESYRRLGGEVEARNVQGRMNMSEAERQATPFNSTFDVPAEQQILRRKGGIASEMAEPGHGLKSIEDVQALMKQKTKEYGSRNEFLASEEYKKLYPTIKQIHDGKIYEFVTTKQAEMQKFGISNGDTVTAFAQGSFGGGDFISGKVFMKKGVPWVRLDNPQMTSIGVKKEIPWSGNWKKAKGGTTSLSDFASEMERLKS